MNLLNALQWFYIALSLVSLGTMIYFLLQPRKLRRLFLQKCKFLQVDDRGSRNVYGYVIAWIVVTPESQLETRFVDEPEVKKGRVVGTTKVSKQFLKAGQIGTMVIIEPRHPHPSYGYQNVIAETKNVILL